MSTPNSTKARSTRSAVDTASHRALNSLGDDLLSSVPGVHSRVEVVQISAVEAERNGIAARCFSTTELAEISGRRVQTMAGLFAVKKALVGLFSSLGLTDASESDFIVSHDEHGAPCLTAVRCEGSAGTLPLPSRIQLSISHTRERAYGLVAYQEAADV